MNDKIKQHFKDHKELYIGLAIGVVTMALLIKGDVIKNSTLINSPYKSKIIEINLERRGHPGNIVKCIQTGEMFASQRRAADLLELNPSEVSKQIRGLVPEAGGYTFELIGLAS